MNPYKFQIHSKMIRRVAQQTLSTLKGQSPFMDIVMGRSLCTHTYLKSKLEVFNIGQVTPFEHPYLFDSEMECTPGITHKEYKMRRSNLVKALTTGAAKHHERHLVVLTANEIKTMSNDIPFFFHQDVDFLYLTGLNEPNAILVLEYTASSNETNFILFVQPKDPKRELWDGAVVGESAAVDFFQADEAHPLSTFPAMLKERYGGKDWCVWTKKGKDFMNTKNYSEITKTFQSKQFKSCTVEDIRSHIQKLRVVKSFAEAKLLQASTTIASNAFKEAMQHTRPGDSESLIHAVLEFNCKAMGAQHLSFPPVVAGGNRANTLHYIMNNQLLKDNDLVLMDGGCVHNGYASDITRTWPVNGHFTEPQALLYNIVLNVMKGCYAKCKTGSSSLNSLHTVMLDLLGKELQQIGLISPTVTRDSDIQQAAAKFCPHHLGHYLGMDTHDCPLVYRGIPLKPGMTFTLEPGLYIPHDAVDVPSEFRGIGIRIEDDVLMTEEGPLNMTGELPKEIYDIEELMKT